MDIEKAIHSTKTFVEFLTRLREHEVSTTTKYVLTDGHKSFHDEGIKLSKDLRLHWQKNVPYFHFGTRTYSCHQGKDTNIYQKEKYAKERDRKATDDHAFTKRYNKAQLTKKLDCPATVYVTRIIRMPEFEIPESLEVTRSRKDRMSLKIKQKITEASEVGEECYIFNLPCEEDHKFHFKGDAAATTEKPDPKVRNYISELVRRGERSAKVVSKLLQVYVETECGEKDKLRRRFYSDVATIRKIMGRAKTSIRNSTIDQEETQMNIDGLDPSKHKVVFRPYTNKPNLEDDNEEEQDESLQQKNNLLFVYQSSEMQSLYRRYDGNAILLDATALETPTLSDTEINSFIEEQNNITKSILKIKGVTNEDLLQCLNIQRYFINNLKSATLPNGLTNADFIDDNKFNQNDAVKIDENFSRMDSDDSVDSMCMVNPILEFHDYCCKDSAVEESDEENVKFDEIFDKTPVKGEPIDKNKPYCIRCKVVLDDISKYKEHMRNSHPRQRQKAKKKLWQCELCGKVFTGKQALQSHGLTHSGQVACICEICGMGFKSLFALQTHLQIHGNQRSYVCELCDKRFNTKEVLRLHVYMVHNPDQWKFSCPICHRKFSLRSNMNNHLNIHANKSYDCDKCRKKFRNVKCLARHQKIC